MFWMSSWNTKMLQYLTFCRKTISSGILSHPTLKFELHAKHQQQHSCTDSISVACSVFRNHPTFGEISHEDLTQSSVSRTLSACNDRNCLGNPYIYTTTVVEAGLSLLFLNFGYCIARLPGTMTIKSITIF